MSSAGVRVESLSLSLRISRESRILWVVRYRM